MDHASLAKKALIYAGGFPFLQELYCILIVGHIDTFIHLQEFIPAEIACVAAQIFTKKAYARLSIDIEVQ